jgi:hypothetical protein
MANLRAGRMNRMAKFSNMRYSSVARVIAMVFVMLLASPTVFAADSHSYAPFALEIASENDAAGTRHADTVLDTVERLGSPAEAPPHCHLESPHAQASGPAQTSLEVDLPSLALTAASVHAPKTELRSPAISARVPIAGPPRFILFGNFRS